MITNDDIIYFVLVDRFRRGAGRAQEPGAQLQPGNPRGWHGGDFAGLIESIPYLKRLGITAIWISPVYLSTGEFYGSFGYHGYWALDFGLVDPHLYRPDPDLAEGSKEYLARLVRAMHTAGIKVILDMVVNHAGYGYLQSEYPNKPFGAQHFNQEGKGDIKGELLGLPDLNHDQPYVVDWFVQNILEWIYNTGIDAIRFDTAKHVEPAFWHQFKASVRTARRDIAIIGEVLREDIWDIPDLANYQREHDFDAVFDFPLRKKIQEVLIGDQPCTWLAMSRLSDDEVRGVLDHDRSYTNAARLVTLLDNHDMPERIFTTILNQTGHWDRNLAIRIMKLCLAFLMTTRGIPQLYYGNELAVEGGSDPDNRRDFPWDIIDEGTWGPHASNDEAKKIHAHACLLTHLRAEHPALRSGAIYTLWSDALAYSYLRHSGEDLVVIVINNGHAEMGSPLPIPLGVNANLPPRIIQQARERTFVDACDPQACVRMEGDLLPVSVPGKTARILVSKT